MPCIQNTPEIFTHAIRRTLLPPELKVNTSEITDFDV